MVIHTMGIMGRGLSSIYIKSDLGTCIAHVFVWLEPGLEAGCTSILTSQTLLADYLTQLCRCHSSQFTAQATHKK